MATQGFPSAGVIADDVRAWPVGPGGAALPNDDAAAGTTAPIPVGGIYNSTLPTYTAGDRTQLQSGSRGSLNVQLMDGNGTSFAGVVNPTVDGVASRTGLTVGASQNFLFNGATWDRAVKPNAASRIASAAATVNATSAKGSAGNVFKVFGNNVKASVVYLKIYNKATAPTVGTDVPVLTIPIAASARFDIDIGDANGFYLGTGIAYGFTTDAADNGTTALSAGDILDFTMTYA